MQTIAGFAFGVYAAALVSVLSIQHFENEAGYTDGEFVAIIAAWVLISAFVLAVPLAVFASVPAALAIVLAEAARLRGMTSNLLLGGAVAAAAVWLKGAVLEPAAPAAVLAAGFTGGFVYWVIAGRSAGSWLKVGDRNAQ